MKLFKIKMRHCAPRDCKESIFSYVLANDESQVLNYIDKEILFGIWSDRHHDSLSEPIVTKEEGKIIHIEVYKEKMLRIKGEFNDENADYSDAYYGITHYGWEEGIEISESDANILLKLNLVIKIND